MRQCIILFITVTERVNSQTLHTSCRNLVFCREQFHEMREML